MNKKILTMVMLTMTAVSMSTGAVFAQTPDSSNTQVSSADKKAPVEEENTFMGKVTSVTSDTVEIENIGKEGRPKEKPADGEEPPAKPENNTDRPKPIKETKTEQCKNCPVFFIRTLLLPQNPHENSWGFWGRVIMGYYEFLSFCYPHLQLM